MKDTEICKMLDTLIDNIAKIEIQSSGHFDEYTHDLYDGIKNAIEDTRKDLYGPKE